MDSNYRLLNITCQGISKPYLNQPYCLHFSIATTVGANYEKL
ncbi:hypothetical protein QQ008_07345 [Fulvivirgaceae bacterium BMA10]|uniref:Uncharacterized protein n=1 Tax=Splendidivirga corallicola TaxID=3051826 RepID=A0ABT8KKD0_9BACT|nr:hypothetical protein [Fulvivirgaceae bacterium BMA10]